MTVLRSSRLDLHATVSAVVAASPRGGGPREGRPGRTGERTGGRSGTDQRPRGGGGWWRGRGAVAARGGTASPAAPAQPLSSGRRNGARGGSLSSSRRGR